MQEHQDANESYIAEGVQLLEVARRAHGLFLKQTAFEKRRLLDFVLSNSTWKDEKLTATFRQPFGLLAQTNVALRTAKAAGLAPSGLCSVQRGGRDSKA